MLCALKISVAIMGGLKYQVVMRILSLDLTARGRIRFIAFLVYPSVAAMETGVGAFLRFSSQRVGQEYTQNY